jgi:hypothetical protein
VKDRNGFSIGAMEKKRTKRHRLGIGEFQYKEGFNVARMEPGLDANGPTMERMHREALFLEAVFELEPKVLSSLEVILSGVPKDAKVRPIPPLIDRRLREWCSRWNLNATWCLEFLQQLAVHRSLLSKSGAKKLTFKSMKARASAQQRAADPFKDQHFKIDFGSWPLTQQTKSAFRKECERLFRRELNAFCNSLEEQAIAAGMERTREMREPVHFQWLARRIVKGERIADIQRSLASSVSATQRAIGKAINELARALDLALPAHSSDA